MSWPYDIFTRSPDKLKVFSTYHIPVLFDLDLHAWNVRISV